MSTSDPQASHPDAPWMRQKDWARGRIRCHSRSATVLAWIMTLFWNGFSWSVLVLVWEEPDRKPMAKVLILFCLVGLGLLLASVYQSLVRFRFGSSFFTLSLTPGVIGGTLEGLIETRLKRRPEAPIQLTLTCKRHRRSRSTGRRRTGSSRTDLLWQGGRQVKPGELVPGPRGLSIPVRLHIPYGLKSSDSEDPADQIIWNLGATGDIPGVDFAAEFTVPVFVTGNSRPELTEQRVDELTDGEGGLVQPVDRGTSWVPPVVVRPTAAGGLEYLFRFPATLKVAFSVTGLAIAVCAGSVLLYLWLGEAGPFALLPGAIGVLLLLATAGIWTFKSRVVVEHGQIVVRKSLLGIPRYHRIPYAEVTAVRVKREVVEGVKEEERDWDIKIERSTGKVVDLGASIQSRAEAVRVAEEIERLVGEP